MQKRIIRILKYWSIFIYDEKPRTITDKTKLLISCDKIKINNNK